MVIQQCLILKLKEYKESSLLVTVLHPQLGKQEFLAKGAKHISAKLTPALQPLHLVNLWLAPTRANYPIIREIEVLGDVTPGYLLGLRIALRMAKMLDTATYPLMDTQELFNTSEALLKKISQQRQDVAQLTTYWLEFEIAVLEFLGIKPSLREYKDKSATNLARFLEQKINQFIT